MVDGLFFPPNWVDRALGGVFGFGLLWLVAFTYRHVRGREGLGGGDGTLTALQQAWIAHQVPQCGYCQAGQIMQAAALLTQNPKPNHDQIREAMSGNICRCGTYPRIRAAVKRAADIG